MRPKPPGPEPALPQPRTDRLWLICGGLIFVAGMWSYGDTLWELVQSWNNEPDYSHGFLVAPVAAYFLWLRRAKFPGLSGGNPWAGFSLLALSIVLRYLDGRFYLHYLEGCSIVVWLTSVVVTLGGFALAWWSLPSICFLAFMIPLPYSLELTLSQPLRRIATKISCWSLQVLGQPAFSEGNVILVGDNTLEVARACSGLRLFVSISALAYAYVVILKRQWWEKLCLVVALVPIAIISNAARIVATGLLYQATTNEAVRKMSHDLAGWGMIPVAAALFCFVLWYLKKLIREEQVMDLATLVRESKAKTS